MREITIKIPDGYFAAIAARTLPILFIGAMLFLLWPRYQIYAQRAQNEAMIERVEAEKKAREISGEVCK